MTGDKYIEILGIILAAIVAVGIAFLSLYSLYWAIKDEIRWQRYLKRHNDFKLNGKS